MSFSPRASKSYLNEQLIDNSGSENKKIGGLSQS